MTILFVVGELLGAEEGVCAALVEKERFSETGYLDDQYTDFAVAEWNEITESIYEPDDEDMTAEEAHNDLISQGFVYCEALATSLEGTMLEGPTIYRPQAVVDPLPQLRNADRLRELAGFLEQKGYGTVGDVSLLHSTADLLEAMAISVEDLCLSKEVTETLGKIKSEVEESYREELNRLANENTTLLDLARKLTAELTRCTAEREELTAVRAPGRRRAREALERRGRDE